MTPTTLAERIADCEAGLARARRLGRLLSALLALGGAAAGLWAAGWLPALVAAAGGTAAGQLPALIRRVLARRQLARMEADHPETFPVAMDRYRMVMATERASRYKLYC